MSVGFSAVKLTINIRPLRSDQQCDVLMEHHLASRHCQGTDTGLCHFLNVFQVFTV